mmetsp:Transcript_26208/g.52530  ORF Transcript_26208/g.52530 Transcript_26208/m.52530 type:complete len:218 (-) Transcript_26208:68-721(-)
MGWRAISPGHGTQRCRSRCQRHECPAASTQHWTTLTSIIRWTRDGQGIWASPISTLRTVSTPSTSFDQQGRPEVSPHSSEISAGSTACKLHLAGGWREHGEECSPTLHDRSSSRAASPAMPNNVPPKTICRTQSAEWGLSACCIHCPLRRGLMYLVWLLRRCHGKGCRTLSCCPAQYMRADRVCPLLESAHSRQCCAPAPWDPQSRARVPQCMHNTI